MDQSPHDSMSVYPKNRIVPLLKRITLPPSYRIIPSKYETTPLGTKLANSRFCTTNSNFSILYAASDFYTVFIEVVIRDRFTQIDQRKIYRPELTDRSYVSIISIPNSNLIFLDLRQDGCTRLGAPTDAVNASIHCAGQELGQEIYSNHSEVDGLLFSSRLTGNDIYAIFDRAISKLSVIEFKKIIDHQELPKIFNRYEIKLI
ncbi:MAG: RES family NAD+ phosphorylase [Rhodobacteraceae bacterium]|nr:RES family NAD+ phosphorylase [Paracoccaceae bacterium]MCY4249991.1 RES family NAD+ phosphorylase [Paracoccaceae bacterium]